MAFRIKLVPEKTNWDFIGKRFLAFALSAIFVFGSIGWIAIKGINLGVDFTGGTLIEIQAPAKPDLPALRETVDKLGLGSISLQEFGDPQNILIRMPQQEDGADAQKAAIEKMRASLDSVFSKEGTVDYRRIEYVGPQVGDELRKAGIIAFVLSLLGIMGYIWWRFEWQFAFVGILALIHDAIATLGFIAVAGFEFDLSTMGALLLISGYSINDTVVNFDRVRENLRKFKKMPLIELLNLSINDVLSRSLMTSVTTFIALLALAIFGGEVIRGFTWALIFGVVVGTYSSVYIAGALLLYLNVRRVSIQSDAAEPA